MAKLRRKLHEVFVTWALRVRSPEAAPIILTQRRVYVLPTRGGLAFATVLAVMLIGAINYNLSLGYGLVFLLASLGIICILHAFYNLVLLQIRPGHCEPVFAGAEAQFNVILSNQRRQTRHALSLNFSDTNQIITDLPAHASTTVALPLITTRRGWLAMPRLTLATNYPLGLIRAWSYCVPDQRCLVYPAPASQAPPLPQGSGEGEGSNTSSPEPDDFHGLRTYQSGDPLRQVAWKAVARHDQAQWLSKQFSGAQASTLWLNWDDLSPTLDMEQRIAILTRWVLEAEQSGTHWGLRLPNKELTPAGDPAHRHTCLQALALYE